MRKLVIIEDEDQVVTNIKNQFCDEEMDWFYVNSTISPRIENKPYRIITKGRELGNIFDNYFNEKDECILFIDIQLRGIISNTEEFSKHKEFLNAISEIKMCKSYLIVLISTNHGSAPISLALENLGVETNNIIRVEDFKMGKFDEGLKKVEAKWDSLCLDLKSYFDSIFGLSSEIVHNFNEYEIKEHLTKLANLLDYRSIDSLYSSIELSNEDAEKLFSDFLKSLVEFKKNGVTLMGIFFIAWRVIEKNKFSDAKKEFLNTLVTINKLGNSEYFIRESFVFAKNSEYIKNIENVINLERFFTLIFVNKEDNNICNLSSVQASDDSLIFNINIDFKKFITKVKKHMQALLDPACEEHDRNETSRTFVAIFKNIIYSDEMDRMNGVVLQESSVIGNRLILKFIV